MVDIMQILKLAVEKKASDIHLTANTSPSIRICGSLVKVNTAPLSSEEVKQTCYSLISDEQKAQFEENKSLDFSFYVKSIGRFRGALMFQKGYVSGVLRVLSNTTPSIDDLGLSPSVRDCIEFPNGLVLVTGPTGSGKTTTLSSFVNEINMNKHKHILTIEDPIEIVYKNEKSIISQREIGLDCKSFESGLRNAMRMDPDICLVGEMRDRETTQAVLSLAETGHLVFSTLHTNSAAKSIDRLISMFPVTEKQTIQDQLSTVLKAIVSQRLVPSIDKKHNVAILEVMFVNSAIQNLIRDGKVYQINSVIQTNTESGMISMNKSLCEAVINNKIHSKDAFEVSDDKKELYKMLTNKNFKIAKQAS